MSFLSKLFGGGLPNALPSSYETGIILAGSLLEGRPNYISDAERPFVEAAGLPPGFYAQERFMLRAAAAVFAAMECLALDVQNEVGRGFGQWFADYAKQSEQNAIIVALHTKSRMPAYLAAARRNRVNETQEAGALSFSEIGSQFEDHLLTRTPLGAAAKVPCMMLGMAVATANWSAQLEGSKQLFRRTKLIS